MIALRHLTVISSGSRLAEDRAAVRTSASAKDIADTYGIPLPLLSKVLQKLARGGLLVSEQGTNGGYKLARDASEISALEVIRTIDGPIILTQCFTEHKGCVQTELCPVREPLRKVHEGILGLLSSITLADLSNDEMPLPVRTPLTHIKASVDISRIASS